METFDLSTYGAPVRWPPPTPTGMGPYGSLKDAVIASPPSISSPAAFPANPYRWPENGSRKPTSGGSGPNSEELFALYVPEPSSLKMFPAFCTPEPWEPSIAAYVAGLVDGDGSIWIHRGRTSQLYPAVAIRLGWKGKSTLEDLRSVLGGTSVVLERRPANAKHAEVYRWAANGTQAHAVLTQIYPYLRIKKAQAATAIHLHWIWTTSPKDCRYRHALRLKALMTVLNRTGQAHALPVAGRWLLIPEYSMEKPEPKWSETWPRSATCVNGIAFQRAPLVPLTDAIASGSSATWQTPTVKDGEGRPYTYPNGNHDAPFLTLLGQARKWPTPAARDWKGEGIEGQLPNAIGGQLNPTWVEWLMGFPLGWSDLGDSATPSSPRSPSGSDAA